MGLTGAEVLVQNLLSQGVERVFTLPGAKIDRVLEAIRALDGKIELILCRNEQSAAFMAAGHGRRTGSAGVVLVTSGPGVANLTTSLITATCEGDAVVAIGGAVPLSQRLKRTHQSMDNVGILRPVCKYAVEIDSPLAIGEVIGNAFRNAEEGRPGAAFVSIPMDVMVDECPEVHIMTPVKPPSMGPGNRESLDAAAAALNKAKQPLILSGGLASTLDATIALRALLSIHPIPVVSTFQGTGTVAKEMAYLYCGRVGICRNQPGDNLLESADCILAIGYDVIEYDATLWNNSKEKKTIIHLDAIPYDVDNNYCPDIEVVGSIAESLRELTSRLTLSASLSPHENEHLIEAKKQRDEFLEGMEVKHVDGLVHPLDIVSGLQKVSDESDDVTYFVDMGSFHIWIARYLVVHRPRQLVNTNGQQTLGVALPWAMSAAFDAKKNGTDMTEKLISVSGDGGFLFSAAELDTAVRYDLNFVHIIFDDMCYNMVKVQQEKKYHGKSCAVNLGAVDFVKFAESMGATGFKVTDAKEVYPTIIKAIGIKGPVVIQIMVDYSDNGILFEETHDSFH